VLRIIATTLVVNGYLRLSGSGMKAVNIGSHRAARFVVLSIGKFAITPRSPRRISLAAFRRA
jgi:hypothetical protein